MRFAPTATLVNHEDVVRVNVACATGMLMRTPFSTATPQRASASNVSTTQQASIVISACLVISESQSRTTTPRDANVSVELGKMFKTNFRYEGK